MSQQLLFETIPCDKYDLVSKDELTTLCKGYEKAITYLKGELKRAVEESQSFKTKKVFLLKKRFLPLRRSYLDRVQKKRSLGVEENPRGRAMDVRERRRFSFPASATPMSPLLSETLTLITLPSARVVARGCRIRG